MALQDYFEFPTAYNPDTEALQREAVFQVFAVDDLAQATPLQVYAADSGTPISTLASNNIGMLPSFRVAGNPAQVVLKSGPFVTLLTSKYGTIFAAGLTPETIAEVSAAALAAEQAVTAAQDELPSAAADAVAAAVSGLSLVTTSDVVRSTLANGTDLNTLYGATSVGVYHLGSGRTYPNGPVAATPATLEILAGADGQALQRFTLRTGSSAGRQWWRAVDAANQSAWRSVQPPLGSLANETDLSVLGDELQAGVYNLNSSSTYSNAPAGFSGAGTLEVFAGVPGSTGTVQRLIHRSSGRMWQRGKATEITWSPWLEVSAGNVDPAAIESAVDALDLPQQVLDAVTTEVTGLKLPENYVSMPARAVVSCLSVPVQVNSQRRYIQSGYTQDSVTTWGEWEFVVLVGSDLHAHVCKRAVGAEVWIQQFDLTTIEGNPFGTQFDDSHATWVLAVDVNGRVLVTGNAHTTIAVTAYSAPAGDVSSWTMIPASENQQGVTYDKFAVLGDGIVLRFWREGFATQGVEWFARWNPTTLAFEGETELLDGAASGEGPYLWRVATRGQQISLFFCWRGAGDASTNSDMCYLESVDGGLSWQRRDGTAQTLPVTHATADVIMAIPAGSGLINQGGSEIDRDFRPHVAFLMQVGTATQVIHLWDASDDGSGWDDEQVTSWRKLIPTVGETTLDLVHARPQIVCTPRGKTYVITRSEEGEIKGAPVAIDVSPGADRTPFPLASMDLYHWEPAIDARALRDRNELKMLIVPTDPNKDSKQDFTKQWAGVLTIDLDQIEQVRNRTAKIPTIRSYAIAEWGPEFVAGTTSEANFVGKTVYVATSSGGPADLALQVGPGVPQIAARAIGPGMRFFVRQSVRLAFQNGATSADVKLRETRSAGSLPEHDVAHIALPANTDGSGNPVANNALTGIRETAWCPLPGTPYIEADGTIRDTRLVPRLRSSVANGLRLGAWRIEIGVLDWV